MVSVADAPTMEQIESMAAAGESSSSGEPSDASGSQELEGDDLNVTDGPPDLVSLLIW